MTAVVEHQSESYIMSVKYKHTKFNIMRLIRARIPLIFVMLTLLFSVDTKHDTKQEHTGAGRTFFGPILFNQ